MKNYNVEGYVRHKLDLAKKIEITGKSEGVSLVWHTVLIEGEDYLYQICFWTLKGRENKHMEQLFHSAKTFNEL